MHIFKEILKYFFLWFMLLPVSSYICANGYQTANAAPLLKTVLLMAIQLIWDVLLAADPTILHPLSLHGKRGNGRGSDVSYWGRDDVSGNALSHPRQCQWRRESSRQSSKHISLSLGAGGIFYHFWSHVNFLTQWECKSISSVEDVRMFILFLFGNHNLIRS